MIIRVNICIIVLNSAKRDGPMILDDDSSSRLKKEQIIARSKLASYLQAKVMIDQREPHDHLKRWFQENSVLHFIKYRNNDIILLCTVSSVLAQGLLQSCSLERFTTKAVKANLGAVRLDAFTSFGSHCNDRHT